VRAFATKIQAKFPAVHILINNGEATVYDQLMIRF
jgi:hypothetical protein